MAELKRFYITTAIAYASAIPHIGNVYEIILSDAIARAKRLEGYEVFFQTGTDEHGEKIQLKAEEKGITPQQYVDDIATNIDRIYRSVDASYDQFIRTTNSDHMKTVQDIFEKLYKKGDIYKGEYEGLYCVPCESFFMEKDLVNGCCPDCGRPVEYAKEEAYFLKLQKYQSRLVEYINTHEGFIEPESRKNEMLNNFLKDPLPDLCVSRTSFNWGVPVSFDSRHVVYVWIDALSNYITGLGYHVNEESDQKFKEYWPADVHVIGKDILRFHTIYWPIILMALDLPLPKKIFGHPWILFGDNKMSKSKGNVMYIDELNELFGVDAVRYYCLHEIPFGSDGSITYPLLIERINADLANTLGNLVNRTIAMVNKYFNGTIDSITVSNCELDQEFKSTILDCKKKCLENIDRYHVGDSFENIFVLLRRANKYIDETEPWKLAKDPEATERLKEVLANLLEAIRIAAVLLQIFMPRTAKEIFRQTQMEGNTLESISNFQFQPIHVGTPTPLFQRIDPVKKMAEIEKMKEEKENGK